MKDEGVNKFMQEFRDYCDKKVDVRQYIQLLHDKRIITPKMTQYLETLTLYKCDGEVYKLMLISDAMMPKRAKKIGIDNQFGLIKDGLPKNKLISPPEINIDKGLYMIQYIFNGQKFAVYDGESKKFV